MPSDSKKNLHFYDFTLSINPEHANEKNVISDHFNIPWLMYTYGGGVFLGVKDEETRYSCWLDCQCVVLRRAHVTKKLLMKNTQQYKKRHQNSHSI